MMKVLLAIYFTVSLVTLYVWTIQGKYSVTGDEPHYLIIAHGVIKFKTLEQTAPYKDVCRLGLPPLNLDHVVGGPHGLYNVHNIGLPLLLALPFAAAGVIGAKIFMIILSSLVVMVCWRISGIFSSDNVMRFLSVAVVTFGLPLIPAANQIYPDIIAGLLCLNAFYIVLTVRKKRRVAIEIFLAASIAFLPWLHIKFAAPALVLGIAVAYLMWQNKNSEFLFIVVLTLALSLVGLALYNSYAFGNPLGPYQDGALAINRNSIMVFFGLLFDQNHGFLLQNPVHFVGILFLGALFKEDWKAGLVLTLTFLSLIVPNALHPGYGGWSFYGRFQWAGTVLFMGLTIFGLIRLSQYAGTVCKFMIGACLLLQLSFFWMYTFSSVGLYNLFLLNDPVRNWLRNYSIFYFPFQGLLPAAYNVDWAGTYLPNYVFGLFTLTLVFVGFVRESASRVYWILGCLGSAVAILGAGFLSGLQMGPNNPPVLFAATDLPSITGRLEGGDRLVVEGIDAPGCVTFGPDVSLRKGRYKLIIRYKSSAPENCPVGNWDIYSAEIGKPSMEGLLFGTSGGLGAILTSFDVSHWTYHPYHFRTFWVGSSDFRVINIELQCEN